MDLKKFAELLMTKPWSRDGSGHTLRKAFLRRPVQFMDLFGLRDPADRALVCAYDVDGIAGKTGILLETLKAFESYMQTEDGWPEPGNTDSHYWESGEAVCEPTDGAHPLWSGPDHRIIKVFTGPLIINKSDNELIFLADGVLPGATMRIYKRTEGSDVSVPPQKLGSDSDSYHACSIRQVYVRTIVDVPDIEPGAYTLSIANEGWSHPQKDGIHYTIQIRR